MRTGYNYRAQIDAGVKTLRQRPVFGHAEPMTPEQTAACRATGPYIGGGTATRNARRRHSVPAFVAYLNGLRDIARLRQENANDDRAARTWAPLVIRPLVVAVDPQTGERHVLSELRREYHPGTSEAFVKADKARRMGDQSLATALKTVGLVGAIKGRLARLLKSA